MGGTLYQLNTKQTNVLAALPDVGTTDLMSDINAYFQSIGQDPQVLGAVDASLVGAVLGVMTAASIADVGADCFDFASGTLLAKLMSPLVDAVITGPAEAALTKYFRWSAPNVTRIIDLLQGGFIDTNLAREGFELNSIAEPFIGPLIASGLANLDKAQLTESQLNDSEIFKSQLASTTTSLDLLKPDITLIASEARAARTKYLTYTRRLKRSQGTHALNQGYIDDALADSATVLDDVNATLKQLMALGVPEGQEINLPPQPQIPTNYTPIDVANLAFWARDLHIAIGRAWSEASLALSQSQKAELQVLKSKTYVIPPPAVKPSNPVIADPFSGLVYKSGGIDVIQLTTPASAKSGDIVTVSVDLLLNNNQTYFWDLTDNGTVVFTSANISNVTPQHLTQTGTFKMPNANASLVAELRIGPTFTPAVSTSPATITLTTTTPTGNKSTPGVQTTLSAASITLGQSITDQCTIWGLPAPPNPVPTGTIQFYWMLKGGAWTALGSPVSAPVATSISFTPSQAGTYYLKAVYSGDSNYNTNDSGATTEVLTVAPAPTGSGTPTSFTISGYWSVPHNQDLGLTIHVVGPANYHYKYIASYPGLANKTGDFTINALTGTANQAVTGVIPPNSGTLSVQLIDYTTGQVYQTLTQAVTVF
jgi:Bacterial Ig-like domain (group 3)